MNKLSKAEKRGGMAVVVVALIHSQKFKREEWVKVKEGGCMGGGALTDPLNGW